MKTQFSVIQVGASSPKFWEGGRTLWSRMVQHHHIQRLEISYEVAIIFGGFFNLPSTERSSDYFWGFFQPLIYGQNVYNYL